MANDGQHVPKNLAPTRRRAYDNQISRG